VPGSLDTRPVFPPDTIRPIENALIKARTSALQAQQEQMRSQQQLLGGIARGRPPPNGPYRETPTPPSGPRMPYGHAYHPPNGPGANGRPMETPVQQGYPQHHNPQVRPNFLLVYQRQTGRVPHPWRRRANHKALISRPPANRGCLFYHTNHHRPRR
jgi:pre-mRNA cleavage complex 2 protein Pcf11